MFSDVHRYLDLSDWHLRLFLSRTRVQLEVSGVAPSGNGIPDTTIASLTESPHVVAEVDRFRFALVSLTRNQVAQEIIDSIHNYYS